MLEPRPALTHPTPLHIRLAIAEAFLRHDEDHPEDPIPLSARQVVRDAITAACAAHDTEARP